MPKPLQLHPDRLFPAEPQLRAIARELYGSVKDLPIVSPHGHCDPAWFATDAPWTNATELLLAPDHYLYRMLYSQGVPLEALGVFGRTGTTNADPRDAWRLFASHYDLFRGTPSRIWLDHVFAEVFGIDIALDARFSSDATFIRADSTSLATIVRKQGRQGEKARDLVRDLEALDRREQELAALTAPETRRALAESGVELADYGTLEKAWTFIHPPAEPK